jgi:methylmalonyl-CoA mutase cobalamin-binding subunit
VDVVARSLGAKDEVIANVPLDEAVAVVAADHRIGQVHVFDLGLQLAAMMFADSATEDHADFVGLSDLSIGIEQSFAEVVQGCATTEDEIVAEFDLREE